jgi:hypothetical protein
MALRALATIACTGFALSAQAHETGLSYLRLQVDGARIDAEVDLGLGDAAAALGLSREKPPDADPAVAREALWREIEAQGGALEQRVRPALALTQDGAPCPLLPAPSPLGREPETGFAQLRFTARCPAPGAVLGLAWTLPFSDPQHRALVRIARGESIQSVILSAASQRVELPIAEPDARATFTSFVAEGVRHIATGPDHLLFLMALLLPAPLFWSGGRWHARPSARDVFREVVATVTAFTVAHSLTLALSALGALTLPGRFVEAAIAASVGVAALNGIRPFLRGRPWHVAFAFGLLHGLGFARYLTELGLPTGARLRALLAFNLGVELGQLAFVAVTLPPLLWLGRRTFYRRGGLPAACFVIAAVAALWVIERLSGA